MHPKRQIIFYRDDWGPHAMPIRTLKESVSAMDGYGWLWHVTCTGYIHMLYNRMSLLWLLQDNLLPI